MEILFTNLVFTKSGTVETMYCIGRYGYLMYE